MFFIPEGSNLVTLIGLIVVTLLVATLWAVVRRYKKKQEQELRPFLSICKQVKQMSIDLFDKTEKDFIKTEIKEQIDDLRLQLTKEYLEESVVSESGLSLATSKLLEEIEELAEKITTSEDLALSKNCFHEIANKISVFLMEYSPEIPNELNEMLSHFHKDMLGWKLFLLAIQQMADYPSSDKTVVEKWSLGFDTLAELIDEWWEEIPKLVEPKIALLAKAVMQAADNNVPQNDESKKRLRELRYRAGFILNKIDPIFLSFNHLGFNREDQIKKNQHAIAWIREIIEDSEKSSKG